MFLLLLLTAYAACSSGDARRGERLFDEKGCHTCHNVGAGDRQGPDLQGVADKYGRERLRQWLHDPQAIYRQTGRRPINPGFPEMPRFPLTNQQIEDLTAYLSTLKKDGVEEEEVRP
ncbi:MAG TPA: cytochrome c [Acidobacteriota bacterium]|nr:cytochrome c [Acidobacteriota bacterium]